MKIRLLALFTLAGLGIASAAAQPSNAQIGGFPPNQSTNQQNYESNSNDPFAQGVEQGNFGGIMNLIHQANLGSRYNPEFFTEQSQQLDEAAAAFRQKQQQQIQQGGVQPSNQQGSTVIKLDPSRN